MREENQNVTVLEVGREVGMTNVSRRALIHALNETTYYRLMVCREKDKCIKCARDVLKGYDIIYWSDKVLLYLDAFSFVYKSNPYKDAVVSTGEGV